MIPTPWLLVLVALLRLGAAHEHAFLTPNPAELGYEPIPLNLSYPDPVPLTVDGHVPAYLNGTLYRGALSSWPDGWWLDGLATVHAFSFESGAVNYRMRWSEDAEYNASAHHVHAPHPETPTDNGDALPYPPNTTWPTGVAFRREGGVLVVSTGVSNVNQIDPETLAPIQLPFQYHDELGGPYLSPTHASTIDGHVLHHLVPASSNRGYVITELKPGSRTRSVIARITNPKAASWGGTPSFQHQQLATRDYYVMLESPCYYPKSAAGSKFPAGHVEWGKFRWNPLARTQLRVVSRATGTSQLYPLPFHLFSIHSINAYLDEQSNELVVDTIQLFPSIVPCGTAFSSTSIDRSRAGGASAAAGRHGSTPWRLRAPLDSPGSTIQPERIGNVTGMEFPTIRYDDLNGRRYTYFYSCWTTGPTAAYYDSLIKINADTGAYVTWSVSESGQYPGEPIFVPDPGRDEEDAGVVMTNVLDTLRNQTYLIVLDARTMKVLSKAGPTPHLIPHGTHGRYYPRD